MGVDFTPLHPRTPRSRHRGCAAKILAAPGTWRRPQPSLAQELWAEKRTLKGRPPPPFCDSTDFQLTFTQPLPSCLETRMLLLSCQKVLLLAISCDKSMSCKATPFCPLALAARDAGPETENHYKNTIRNYCNAMLWPNMVSD